MKIRDFAGKSSWTDRISITDGDFSVSYTLEKPAIKVLGYYRTSKNLFLSPGHDLQISFDATNMDSTLIYKGSLALENSLLDSVTTRIRSYDYSPMYALPLDQAAAYIDSLKNETAQYFTEIVENKQLKQLFNEYTKALIEYNAAFRKIIIGERKDEQPKGYYDFTAELDLENENLLNVPEYRFFLMQYTELEGRKSYEALDSLEKL